MRGATCRLLAAVSVVCFTRAAAPFLYFPQNDVLADRETIFPQAPPPHDVATLSALCDATPGCLGFNSNGWLKNGSASLAPYPVDVYLRGAPSPPPPPPPLWPLPASLSQGGAPLVVSSALAFRAAAPVPPELSAAFARAAAAIFSHGPAAGAAAARAAARAAGGAGAAVLAAIDVTVADAAVPLDLGVNESYTLTLPADGSAGAITAQTVWGALHALTTLAQLVRYDFDAAAYHVIGGAPLALADAPAFAWRGVMVDPARAFLPLATLRALADSLPLAKLNVLHVHLLDCDSFPLQVAPPFERLWAGAFSPRERYSAADLAAFVEHARMRGVRVTFEFDSPGHSGSMCAGHPEVCPTPACNASLYGSDVLDPSSSATLPAIQAVIDALLAAQASSESVLHLGGDEVSDACWLASPAVRAWMAARNYTTGDEVYGYFINATNAMALAAGRSPMRWEEVWKHFGTALDRRVIVHAWLSSAALFDAASHGYRTVFSVNDRGYYLDYLDVQWNAVYASDPLAGLVNASARQFILGGQVCLWGETVDAGSLLSALWPRAAAAAERLWSYNFATHAAGDYDVVTRMAQFRCDLLEAGVPAPLPGAINAGDMRPAWTVGSCGGGFKALC